MYEHHSPETKELLSRNPLNGMQPAWPSENPVTIEAYFATIKRLYPFLNAVSGEDMEANLKHNVKASPDGGWIDRMPGKVAQSLAETMGTYEARYAAIQAPILSIFTLQDGTDFLAPELMSEEQQSQLLAYARAEMIPYYERHIEQVRQSIPLAQIVVIPGGHHYCFIKNEKIVYSAMRAFLEE